MTDFDDDIADHTDAVWRSVYRLLDNRDDALECFQETFLAALVVHRRQAVRNWRGLLLRIATAKAIDRLRERYRRAEVPASDDWPAQTSAAGDRPDAAAQHAELRESVRRALTKLPQPQAEAFWLRHMEELSVQQVAEQMQITPDHSRVLVHRAATALRALLGATCGSAALPEKLP